ncbi:Indole-3-acetic acid-amido synthetase GH3.17 [Acorus gramineus]|uniref:Indole-3-acetic acid-amido synthetase GH3.17 n=1 Tax=Acorus gramineus TaxID=55184 RepID=A0AAV9AZP1_ACOGR|nr:Indole-3-acetic acid-amido synthetase GH3.17 [Acorus gramineus]
MYFIKPETNTPSGLMARPVLTSYYKSKNTLNPPFNRFNVYTSPDETILCSDNKQSMYCHVSTPVRGGPEGPSPPRRGVLRLGVPPGDQVLGGPLEGDLLELPIGEAERLDRQFRLLGRPGRRRAWRTGCQTGGADRGGVRRRRGVVGAWEGIISRLWPRTECV